MFTCVDVFFSLECLCFPCHWTGANWPSLLPAFDTPPPFPLCSMSQFRHLEPVLSSGMQSAGESYKAERWLLHSLQVHMLSAQLRPLLRHLGHTRKYYNSMFLPPSMLMSNTDWNKKLLKRVFQVYCNSLLFVVNISLLFIFLFIYPNSHLLSLLILYVRWCLPAEWASCDRHVSVLGDCGTEWSKAAGPSGHSWGGIV